MIKVLYADAPKHEDLSEEERMFLLESLAVTYPKMWKHIGNFSEMLNKITEQEQLFTKPDLRELLLRKIIYLDQYYEKKMDRLNVLNTIIVPQLSGHIFDINGAGQDHIFDINGGAQHFNPLKRFKPKDNAQRAEETVDIIRIRYDTAVLCQRDNLKYIAPPGEEMSCAGLVIRQAVAAYLPPDLMEIGCTTILHVVPHKDLQYTSFSFATMNEEQQMYLLGNIFDYFVSILTPEYNEYFSILSKYAETATTQPYLPYIHDAKLDDPAYGVLPQFGIVPSSSNLAVTSALYNARLAQAFYNSIAFGRTSPIVLEAQARVEKETARLRFANEVKLKESDRLYKINTILTAISKKLGTKKMQEVEIGMRKQRDPLKLLNASERKSVETEIAIREKYLEEVINNKCPHVALYRKFRSSVNQVDSYGAFAELKKLFGKPIDMIPCTKCGMNIMCPHLAELTEAEIANKKYTEQKAILTKYISVGSTRDYFCKICGEVINSNESFDDVGPAKTAESMMNEELKTFMWSELAIMTKFLKFTTLVNVPALITQMRDTCYPYIFDFEKQILKSKTNSADEIKAKKRLFVIIFGFAYMVHLCLTHKNIEFKNFKIGNKAPIVDMIKQSIDTIMTYANVIIREIPGMTADIIKTKIIEAYKALQKEGTMTVITSNESEDLMITLLLDPVFKYVYRAWVIANIIDGKKTPRGETAVDKIDFILGDNVAELEKSLAIIKKERTGALDIFHKMRYPTFKKNNSVFVESFLIFAKLVHERIFLQPIYTNATSGKEIETVLNPLHATLRQEWEIARKHETVAEWNRRALTARCGKFIGPGWRRFKRPDVSLGRLYDEEGRPHKFDVWITDVGKEVKLAEINKQIESGRRWAGVFVDKKCSTCGVLWSATDSIDENKIRESINAKVSRDNFFRFYENRCPLGGAHVGSPCSKCGLVLGEQSMAFYKKFTKEWQNEKESWHTGSLPAKREAKIVKYSDKYAEEYAAWSFNFNIVLELANKLKINHRLLQCMGAAEKIEYADILSGSYIPQEADNRNDTRIYMLSTYIKNLFTEWLQLSNFNKLLKPPMDLAAMIEASGFNKHKLGTVDLPDVFNDFNARYDYIQRTKKPREIVYFLIQTFCEICLKIWGLDGKSDVDKLRKDFVSYIVAKILRGEELLTKPGYFSWSLLYGDKEPKEAGDSNFTDTDDAPDEPEIEDAEDTPFGTDAFDMEESEDPQDDDPSNQVRVEGLGLD